MDTVWSTVVPLAFASALLIAFAIILGWCIRDAKRRGRSPLLVAIIVLFFFPLGWIAWLLFRPDPLERQQAPPDGFAPGQSALSSRRPL